MIITERIVYYRLEQGVVHQYKQKYDDTVRELLEICHQGNLVGRITPFTVVFDRKQLNFFFLLSQLETTETRCLIITERIVYYRLKQGVVNQYKQKYDDTVRELLGICHQ